MSPKDQKDSAESATDRQFVTALARGLDILGSFQDDDRFLSNHVLAERTGLAKPTVSRLTYTLTQTGHLVRNGTTGEYRLGAKVLSLGFGVLSSMSITEQLANDMVELSRGPNQYVTVALAEISAGRAVYLASYRPKQAVSLSMDVGARLPVFYSAAGRAILAGVSEQERLNLVARGIEEFPDQQSRIEDSTAKAVQDYSEHGFCTSFGDWKPEINAIAVPVCALDGSTTYGVNVGGPSFLASPEVLISEYSQRLIDLSRRQAPA